MKNILKPFTHQTGQIIRHSELFVDKETGGIEYKYKEYPVLISNNTNIIYLSAYGRLSYLDVRKFKKKEYESNTYNIIGEPYVYRRNYGFKSGTLRDGIVAHCYSFQSKKIADRVTIKALKKYLAKEFGAFSRMVEALERFTIPGDK